MKNWFLLLMMMLTTCTVDIPLNMHGEWELSRLESVEEYGLYGLEFTTDTCFENVDLMFDTSVVYLVVDGGLQPLEIVGFNWSTNWYLEWELDTCLWIANEPWSFIVKEPNRIVVENKTLYGIVGSQIRTLYLIKK